MSLKWESSKRKCQILGNSTSVTVYSPRSVSAVWIALITTGVAAAKSFPRQMAVESVWVSRRTARGRNVSCPASTSLATSGQVRKPTPRPRLRKCRMAGTELLVTCTSGLTRTLRISPINRVCIDSAELGRVRSCPDETSFLNVRY